MAALGCSLCTTGPFTVSPPFPMQCNGTVCDTVQRGSEHLCACTAAVGSMRALPHAACHPSTFSFTCNTMMPVTAVRLTLMPLLQAHSESSLSCHATEPIMPANVHVCKLLAFPRLPLCKRYVPSLASALASNRATVTLERHGCCHSHSISRQRNSSCCT